MATGYSVTGNNNNVNVPASAGNGDNINVFGSTNILASTANASGSAVLGNNNTINATNAIALGNSSTISGQSAISLGGGNTVSANAVVLGNSSSVSGQSASLCWVAATPSTRPRRRARQQRPLQGSPRFRWVAAPSSTEPTPSHSATARSFPGHLPFRWVAATMLPQAGAVAIGNGVTTTRANQIAVGTSGNTYTLAGINSAASPAAQTGPVRVVTADAAGNLATANISIPDLGGITNQVSALDGRVGVLESNPAQLRKDVRRSRGNGACHGHGGAVRRRARTTPDRRLGNIP